MDGRSLVICDRVVLYTDVPIQYVTDLKIECKENEHGSIWIKGVLYEDYCKDTKFEFYLEKSLIRAVDKESQSILFNGRLEVINIQQVSSYHEVEILGYSATCLLDKEKKKCSYQNDSLSYFQIVNEVLKGVPGAACIWNAEGEKKTGSPLIQYEETDWEFIIRLSSHFHTVVYSDMITDQPRIHFGMAKGRKLDENDIKIIKYGSSLIYCKNGENPKNIAKYMECQSEKYYEIGDYLIWHGRKYTIFRMKTYYKDGEIIYGYILGDIGMFQKEKCFNHAIAGVRLKGTVKKREQESVFIQLDIDKKEGLFGWPFVPETGNLSYCMPEEGTRAVLYFPGFEESEGIIVHVVNEDNDTAESQNRQFRTIYNKKIDMFPDCLSFHADTERVLLSDKSGIELGSSMAIIMEAANDVILNGRRINVDSPLEITCRTQKANIDMCRDFNFYAPGGVTTQGTGNGEKKKITAKGETKKTESWKASFMAMAAIPVMDLKQGGNDSIVGLKACGAVAKFATGNAVFAVKEVMEGKKEADTSFPDVFRAMQTYAVKGGYYLPKNES